MYVLEFLDVGVVLWNDIGRFGVGGGVGIGMCVVGEGFVFYLDNKSICRVFVGDKLLY